MKKIAISCVSIVVMAAVVPVAAQVELPEPV